MTYKTDDFRHGFTLVELSIVLVILGLLVGGVLTGQSLIRAAELRTVNTQFQTFQTAVMTFRDKYFAIPGDMPNASAYWGAADGSTGSTASCASVSTGTTATCNGNGDGQVDNDAFTTPNEVFRFWQHLANAGLIEGSYSGVGVGGASGHSSANVPKARIANGLWWTRYAGNYTGTAAFQGDYGNSMSIGGYLANNLPFVPVLKPDDLYNIDMKMDDGKPGTGKLVARANGGLSTCTTAADNGGANLDAQYLLSSTAVTCAPTFRRVY